MEATASVILPVYNGEKFLEEMLNSIWRQSYRPIQLVISDDCSTDSSNAIIQAWCREKRKKDFDIKFIHNKRNLGLSANISNALSKAEGKYLFFADQDDIWMDEKIEAQIDYLLKNPDCIICQCDRSIIDEHGTLLYRSENSLLNYMTVKKNLEMVLRTPSIYAANCICLRADCLNKLIPLPDKVVEPDSHIVAIAAHYGNIGYLYKPLVRYRIHENNLSQPYFPKMKFNFIECYKRHVSGSRRYNLIVKNDDAILKELLMKRYHEDLGLYRNRKTMKGIYVYSFLQTLEKYFSIKANKTCGRDPVISVLMAIYKDKEYLEEAIKSIVNQSYKNWEFLIIAEPDTPKESLKIIKSFSDKRIRLIINKKHLGFSESLNRGIKLAKGKYIARMDADDISLPNRLMLQWLYMETHTDVILCGTNAYSINSKGKIIDRTNLPTSSAELKTWLYFKNVIFHPTVMFRRKQFINNQLFYREQQAEDYELWTRVILKYKIVNLRSVLLKRRLHGKNSIGKYRDEIQSADMNTQRNLWRTAGISVNINTPFYDCHKLTTREKKKRRLYIDELERKTPYFRRKKSVIREIRNAYIGNSASI